MKITLFILFCVVVAIVFYALGRVIGNWVGKKQKMQDEVMRNGSKRV